jgi:hypothetical protein
MKKIMIIILILLSFIPSNVLAITTISRITDFQLSYIAKDVYRGTARFHSIIPNKLKFEFWSPGGTYYTHTELHPSGIKSPHYVWLFCNGTYNLSWYEDNLLVGKVENIVTTELKNQPCISTSNYDIAKEYIDNGDDGYFDIVGGNLDGDKKRISYVKIPGGDSYELIKWDENLNDWGTTPIQINDGSTPGDDGYFDIDEGGFYKVIVRDDEGNMIDNDTIDDDEFNNSINNTSCNGCMKIYEMLACPAWDQYVGDIAEAIGGAIPPPPNMNDSIDYLLDQLEGIDMTPTEPEPPAPFDPGYPEQQIDLPEPIETNLTPEPNAFPIETGGDGSGAVVITDPTAWTPDNNDIGYVPPDPDPDTEPEYNPPTTTPETTPDYNPPGATEDTPPDYNPPSTVTDEIPDYNTGNDENETTPDYNTGNENNSNVPDYDYQ